MTKHSFKCGKCNLSFSIESEEENVNEMKKSLKRGVRCPKCDDEWGNKDSDIIQDLGMLPTRNDKKTKESLRRENAERSSEAQRAALEFARQNPNGEMVEISKPRGMQTTQYGQSVERVPKSVVDRIAGAAKESLDNGGEI